MIGAGALDRLVQFQRATPADDGLSATETFADHGAPVWAAKRDVSDGEQMRAGAMGATLTTRFTVRWSPFTADVTPKDQLVCDGRSYRIVGIKEGEQRRRWIEITCAARIDHD